MSESNSVRESHRGYFPLTIGLIIAIAVGWLFLPIGQWLEQAITWFRADPVGGPITYAGFIIVSALLLIPSTIPTVAAGSIWGLFWGFLLLHVVSVMADMACFLIARRYLRAGFKTRCLDKYPRLVAMDKALKEDGLYLTVLMRWCPIVPINVMNYLLGMTALPTRQFFWATALGTLPNSLIFVYLGTLFVDGGAIGIGADPWTLTVGLFLCAVSVIGLTVYARDKLRLHQGRLGKNGGVLDAGVTGQWHVCEALADVPPAVWALDGLPKNLDLPYLSVISEADPRIDWYYCWLVHEQEIKAFTVCQSLDLAPQSSIKSLQTGRLNHVLRLLFKRFNARTLICGNCFMSGVDIWWRAPEITQDTLDRALLRLAVGLSDSHLHKSAFLVFKDLRADMSPSVVHAGGYRAYDIDPCMALFIDPNWRTMADYQAALTTKYRKRYLKYRNQSEHVERKLLTIQSPPDQWEQIYRLYQNVLSRASFCPVQYSQETFQGLQSLVGPEYETIGYYDGDELIAFNTRWQIKDTLYSHFFGMERSVSTGVALYKNIILDDVAAAIEKQCAILHLGRGSQGVKSEIGAVVTSSPLVARHRSFLGQLLWRFPMRFLQAPSWERRNPLVKKQGVGP